MEKGGVLSSIAKVRMANDMVKRQSDDEIPPRVEYSLTEKGMSVIFILQNICQWANRFHREDCEDIIRMKHCEKCDYS